VLQCLLFLILFKISACVRSCPYSSVDSAGNVDASRLFMHHGPPAPPPIKKAPPPPPPAPDPAVSHPLHPPLTCALILRLWLCFCPTKGPLRTVILLPPSWSPTLLRRTRLSVARMMSSTQTLLRGLPFFHPRRLRLPRQRLSFSCSRRLRRTPPQSATDSTEGIDSSPNSTSLANSASPLDSHPPTAPTNFFRDTWDC
jgi:hypothetical protein